MPFFSELFAERRQALHDFWEVYEAEQDAMQKAALVIARSHPVFGPMMQAMTPEQMARQNAESRENLRLGCMEGDWRRYEESLLAQGAMYAQLRIPFASFYDLMRVIDHVLVPAFIASYGKEPERLAAVLRASRELFDHAMKVIAEQYIETKDEEALRLSEESLRATLHSIGDGVIATNAHGAVVRMNPVAEELTGWKIADAHGRPFTHVFHVVNEATGSRAMNPVERVLREGVGVELANHTMLVSKEGSATPIADSAAPIRNARGELLGVVLVFRDMTREREAEKALVEAHAFLDSIVENIPHMIFVKDAHDLRFVRFNKAGEELLGVEREGLIGKSDRDFFPEDQAEFFVTKDRAVLAGKRLMDIPEEPIDTKGGRRWLHTKKIPITDEAGKPRYLLGISEDITERKSMVDQIQHMNEELEQRVTERTAALQNSEEQLRQSQKMEAIGRLAGGVAHDFNNLLSVILSYGEMMRPRSRSRATRCVRSSTRSGARRGVPPTSRGSSSRSAAAGPRAEGHSTSTKCSTSMDKMLARLLGETSSCARCPSKGSARSMVDPSQIEQVVMNLVVNARDAMPDGGQAHDRDRPTSSSTRSTRASTRGVTPGPHVMLAVTDTGIGHEQGHASAHLRAFLHDEGDGQGDRARPLDRLRHRPAERRAHLGLQRGGQRDDVQDLLPTRASASPRRRAAPRGRHRHAGPRRSSSSRTTTRCEASSRPSSRATATR